MLKQTHKLPLRDYLVGLGILVFAFFVLWAFEDFNKDESILSKYGVTTTGTVIEIKRQLKRNRTWVTFEYEVNGKRYRKTKGYEYSMGLIPKEGSIYYVLFYPQDPESCKMYYISPKNN